MFKVFLKDTALVLEGGGMRGAYSAGVLDALLDEGLKFGGYAGTCRGNPPLQLPFGTAG